jgi:D-alanine--poly(phosphoribitol) ligase subunit 2
MTIEQIKENLYNHIMEKYGLDGDPDYTMDVNLFDYGFLDSMGATEVIMWLEETYSIEICQQDIILYPMDTIEEIADVVFGKVS